MLFKHKDSSEGSDLFTDKCHFQAPSDLNLLSVYCDRDLWSEAYRPVLRSASLGYEFLQDILNDVFEPEFGRLSDLQFPVPRESRRLAFRPV